MREKYIKAFNVLHLEPHADKAEIRLAYKKRVQQLHPDRHDENATPERKQEFQDVLNAYKLISDAIKAGEIARESAEETRASQRQNNTEQQEAARPVRANPQMRRHFSTDNFYATNKRTSAVTFVAAIAIIAIVLVLLFTVMGARQEKLSPGKQWDPVYHENRARGIEGADPQSP